MEDEKLDLHPKKARLNVKWKKNFKTYQKKGTRGRKAPKDLTKKAPLQTEASKKNFKTYQKKGTRGRKAPKDLTKKAPLQIEASSTDSLTEIEMNLLKFGIMSREEMNLLKEDMMRLRQEKKSVTQFVDKAWDDHSNCCDQRAKEEDSDSSEPSDDEWKPKWPIPQNHPISMDGFPPFRFA